MIVGYVLAYRPGFRQVYGSNSGRLMIVGYVLAYRPGFRQVCDTESERSVVPHASTVRVAERLAVRSGDLDSVVEAEM
jgi:hypothetical protein